jgi:hypothetical protein
MNIKQVIVLEEAEEDLEQGRAFYDKCEFGIGNYFIDSLIADFESLRIYAGIHGRHYGFYRMLSKRFPFAVYYEIVKDSAVVVAVLDMRREPAWIRNRLI